jgi:hypothetical protein
MAREEDRGLGRERKSGSEREEDCSGRIEDEFE